MAQQMPIDRLLNLVPDAPEKVLSQLREHPQLASQQDGHGYSLVHAAASYGQQELLTALIKEFAVDINIRDEDAETALFCTETIDIAKQLLSLEINISLQNNDGLTAAQKLDDEDEQPEVAAFLKGQSGGEITSSMPSSSFAMVSDTDGGSINGQIDAVHDLPPVPKGLDVRIGTMHAGEEGGAPDPEFRKMIEDLAAREDFQSEAGQQELRDLVSQVVSGINHEQNPSTRRRID